jgi:hypothetical protein
MGEEQKPQRWWQTFPGILTATAGIITAVTSLIVALHQAGVFDTVTKPAPQSQNTTRTSLEATKPPVALAAGTEVRLGSAIYKILAVQLDRYNVEKLTLRFTVRMTNNGPSTQVLWGDSFRLLVDGVPRAPKRSVSKGVSGRSAEEGDVEFVIPAATQSTVLRIWNGNESTEIPFDLLAKPELAGQKK